MHSTALRLGLDQLLDLGFGPDKEHLPAVGDESLQEVTPSDQALDGLPQVDDMN